MREKNVVGTWVVLGCVLCTGCVDELELELEDIEETEQNLTSVVTPAGAGQHMSTPAGTKVVVGPGNKLHAVYEDGGRIKYITSANGVSWTAPIIIGGTEAYTPTIAVAVDGTIGVAYGKGPGSDPRIHYMSRPFWSEEWRPSFKITSNYTSNGYEPSLVALGNTMHLAWGANAPNLYYASFAADLNTALNHAHRFDPVGAPCGTTRRVHPTIAVSHRSAVDTNPLVRVAYLETYDPANCSGPPTLAFAVAERPAAAVGNPWPEVHRQVFAGPWTLDGSSLSHSAIPTTGDFYVAASYKQSGAGTTELHYDNAWNAAPFKHVPLLADSSVVDVTAQIVDCMPSIRYAISDVNQGADGHGPTYYRTGRWVGAAAAPTWTHGLIQISPSGVNAEALFFRKATGASTSRFVPAVYEQLVNGISSIVEETTTAPGVPSPAPCFPEYVPSKKN